jgi:hypothetical protein
VTDHDDVPELELLASDLKQRIEQRTPPARWNAEPEDVRRSVMQLVLTLVEFIRQLLERPLFASASEPHGTRHRIATPTPDWRAGVRVLRAIDRGRHVCERPATECRRAPRVGGRSVGQSRKAAQSAGRRVAADDGVDVEVATNDRPPEVRSRPRRTQTRQRCRWMPPGPAAREASRTHHVR